MISDQDTEALFAGYTIPTRLRVAGGTERNRPDDASVFRLRAARFR